VTLEFLIGAILGSGIAIFAGRAPARRLIAKIHQTWARERR